MPKRKEAFESILDNPWFGFDDNVPPPKEGIFKPRNPHGYSNTWPIEDFLQHAGVFVSGVDNRRCHSDSYMTCVEYSALDAALALLEEQYHPTPDDWLGLLKTWSGGNTQIPLRLVCLTVARRIGVEITLS